MNIIEAVKDKNLFKPFLQDDNGHIATWNNWMAALRCIYGLPVPSKKHSLIEQCTGRKANQLPSEGFSTALFLTGRRSGKSRIAAVIAAFEAVLSGREKMLSKGEGGMVAVLSPTAKQSRVVRNYMRGIFAETPILSNEVVNETSDGFELANGVKVEILVGDFRSVRGFTLLACIVDEICFFGLDNESKVKSDTELIRALKPALATCGGRLIAISSPYAKRGWTYSQYKRNFANDNGKTLVWNCASRVMNPTLSEDIVSQALEEDLQSAKSEYLGEWRDDVCIFLPREVVEANVIKNRLELLPRPKTSYFAFCDVSGGRLDAAALAIAHKDGEKVVLDFIKEYLPPHSPHQVCKDMAAELVRWGIRRITGDNYSAEFVKQAFVSSGIWYELSELPKSGLYLELLPRLCSQQVELLDNERLVSQLSSLERRVRSGGKDIVDHPSGGHDDISNAVAGVVVIAGKNRIVCGAFGPSVRMRAIAFRS